MKLRFGFISNSSTASCIISLDAYENVLDLMIHVFGMIIEEDKKKSVNVDFDVYDKTYSNLIKARDSDLDPNTPVIFGTGYDTTEVVKVKEGFHLTCHLDYNLNDLKGITKEWIEGGYEESEVEFYYLPRFDVVGRPLWHAGAGKKCKKHINIQTKEGDVYCPFCNPKMLKSQQLSSHDEEDKLEFEKNRFYKLKSLIGITEVRRPEFNRDEVLIIDDGEVIYLWFGLSVTAEQKDIALIIAKRIKKEFHQKAKIEIMNQNEENGHFLALIEPFESGSK